MKTVKEWFNLIKDKKIRKEALENMTPQEKARELCDKFLRTYKVSLYPPFIPAHEEAKQCALICVDEIIKEHCKESEHKDPKAQDRWLSFWNEVQLEINKL